MAELSCSQSNYTRKRAHLLSFVDLYRIVKHRELDIACIVSGQRSALAVALLVVCSIKPRSLCSTRSPRSYCVPHLTVITLALADSPCLHRSLSRVSRAYPTYLGQTRSSEIPTPT
jgi:hypothetical protein